MLDAQQLVEKTAPPSRDINAPVKPPTNKTIKSPDASLNMYYNFFL